MLENLYAELEAPTRTPQGTFTRSRWTGSTSVPSSRLYVDYSGDPGFKFGKGSTRLLIVAAVCIEDYSGFSEAILALRRKRGFGATYEYHWAHIPRAERKAFMSVLRDQEFEAWALTVDKQKLASDFRRLDQYGLLSEFVAVLGREVPREIIENAVVVIDERASETALTKSVRKRLSEALRDMGVDGGIRKVRGCPAHREVGLQLADMVAGAIGDVLAHNDVTDVWLPERKIRVANFP